MCKIYHYFTFPRLLIKKFPCIFSAKWIAETEEKLLFFGWAAAARHEERLFFDELLAYSTQHRMMCALSHGKTVSCMKNVHYFVLLFTYVCVYIPDKSQEKKKRKKYEIISTSFFHPFNRSLKAEVEI